MLLFKIKDIKRTIKRDIKYTTRCIMLKNDFIRHIKEEIADLVLKLSFLNEQRKQANKENDLLKEYETTLINKLEDEDKKEV